MLVGLCAFDFRARIVQRVGLFLVFDCRRTVHRGSGILECLAIVFCSDALLSHGVTKTTRLKDHRLRGRVAVALWQALGGDRNHQRIAGCQQKAH